MQGPLQLKCTKVKKIDVSTEDLDEANVKYRHFMKILGEDGGSFNFDHASKLCNPGTHLELTLDVTQTDLGDEDGQ